MKRIFKSIFVGAIKGFPVLNTIRDQFVKSKDIPAGSTLEGQPAVAPAKTDIVAIITELAVVGLIVAFAMGKVTMEDLKALIGILN